ncbi:hypothetical protein RFN28_09540 [Mesorhizobium sp. VK24D]|uniref:Secreted protein n=1 Tax=Mesorhizobium album TaxID=3072314 RepID=A0ABU4XVK0_9HYPH|nr:hypothetical protein [Mesorhizobium sp. VK24D]MDX8478724.1 hypothetical protein [Mesorhizobium sp. VK24D]
MDIFGIRVLLICALIFVPFEHLFAERSQKDFPQGVGCRSQQLHHVGGGKLAARRVCSRPVAGERRFKRPVAVAV